MPEPVPMVQSLASAIMAASVAANSPLPRHHTLLYARAAVDALRSRGAASARCTLTDREREVLILSARGATIPEIAETMKISVYTVKTFMKRGNRRLGARNRSHAVALGFAYGVLRPEDLSPGKGGRVPPSSA
jgi:DNA-binding CsgD family transcriptional regulator